MRRSPGLTAERSAVGVLALAAAGAAALLAAHHPIAPVAACALAIAWFAIAWRWPTAWLVALPALLPVADLSPWTGWVAFDEFDILVLATLAAGHARRAWHGETASPRTWLAMAAGLVLFCAPGLWRGFVDAGSTTLGWFDGDADPVDGLRVVKSAVYALALLPLIEDAMRRDPARAPRRLAFGVLVGLALVTAAAIHERAAYPGLFDTAEPYRTTATFWEMHMGGAALDGYLALATPFVAWALWSARGKWRWLLAATLALLVGYACLTTFSRGVYAAVLAPLVGLGVWLWARRRLSRRRWRIVATALLIVLIGAETLAVLAPESYMTRRMTRSHRDYVGRVAHWQAGLALRRTTADRWLGIGLGRLPARYAASARGGEFSGADRWVDAGGRHAVRLDGPRTDARLGGLFGLTQQVPPRARYRLQLDLRSATGVELYARVCESHLLYDANCQYVLLRAAADADHWRHVDTWLPGAPLATMSRWLRRGTVLTLSVANAGGSADVDDVHLIDTSGRDLVVNGGFDRDLARWWPAAQFHFLPWHIDNLYLELLIERGWLGLALAVGLLVATLARLSTADADRPSIAPFVAAAIVGAAIVGAVSSLLDAPRTAFLLALLIAVAWHLPRPTAATEAMPMP